jgi:hypothetical protein
MRLRALHLAQLPKILVTACRDHNTLLIQQDVDALRCDWAEADVDQAPGFLSAKDAKANTALDAHGAAVTQDLFEMAERDAALLHAHAGVDGQGIR